MSTSIRFDGTPVLAALQDLLDEAGLEATFDPRRDVTLCSGCGKRAEPGSSFVTHAPGTTERSCRMLCPACANDKEIPCDH